MKGKAIPTFACGMALVLSLGLVACEDTGNSTDAETSSEVPVTTSTSSSSSSSQTTKDVDYTNVDNVDFKSIDTKVSYGDNAAMTELVKKVESLAATEQVVEIDGLIAGNGSDHLIIEPEQGDSSSNASSLPFVVVGESAYPNAGTRVLLVGVVREDADGKGVLVVPSERLTAVEEGSDLRALNEGCVVVPKGWTIKKDSTPEQLIISKGGSEIEFWSGRQRADGVLKSGKDLWEHTVNGKVFKGYSPKETQHELACGSLAISASGMYWEEVKDFLEYNLVM